MDFDHHQTTSSYSTQNPSIVPSSSSPLISSPKTKDSESPSELNQYAKQKLNELYLFWIGKKESQNLMFEYMESFNESISSPLMQSPSNSPNASMLDSSQLSKSQNSTMDYKLSEASSIGSSTLTQMKSDMQYLGTENARFSSSDPMMIQQSTLKTSPSKISNNCNTAKISSPKMFSSPNRSSKSQVLVDEVDFSMQHKLSHNESSHHNHHSHPPPINPQNETFFTTALTDQPGTVVSISNSLQNITPHYFTNLSTGSSTPPKSPIHSPTRSSKPTNVEAEITHHPSVNSIRKKLNFSDDSEDNTQIKAGILQRKLQELQNVAINYESQKKKMKMSVDDASFSKIPRFYFPNEKITTTSKIKEDFIKIKQFFLGYPSGVNLDEFGKLVTDICEFPSFFRLHLFSRIDEFGMGIVTCEMYEDYWKQNMQFDNENYRYFNVIKQKNNDYIIPSDFKLILREILANHPGLRFLEQAPQFQEKYAETVIIRIFYALTKSSSIGKIFLREFKNSNLVETLKLLDKEQDTNNEINYFAYEHFYVLFCKFWELDTDRDGMLSKDDLLIYGDSCLTEFIVDRIMSGFGKRLTGKNPNTMSYEDFVWFCLSEEDKTTPVAQEYWFRCVDIDGDGVLSLYELEQVFSEQKERIKQYDPEISFSDIHCQIIDMLKPKNRDIITLADIKKSKMSPIFFNILFNLTKFFVFEQRGTLGTNNVWAIYAKEEYQRLINEDEEEQQDMVDEELEVEDVVIH